MKTLCRITRSLSIVRMMMTLMMTTVLTIGLAPSVLATSNSTSLSKIAATVKNQLQDWDALDGQVRMHRHFFRMGLKNSEGMWLSNDLAAIEDFLAPALTQNEVEAFIDTIALNLAKNPFLMDFLESNALEAAQLQVLRTRLEAQGHKVITDTIAFAIALERLTVALREDWHLIEITQSLWKKARQDTQALKYLDHFTFAKLLSVEAPVKDLVRFHEREKVNPTFLRFMMPLNILEARWEDWRHGYEDNAAVARILQQNPISGPNYRAHFSPDRKIVHVTGPNLGAWIDLYQTWNMAFCTQYDSWTYIISKLLIPSVSGYRDNPEAYVYHRGLSLDATLHWYALGHARDLHSQTPDFALSLQWADPELRRLWGQQNRLSAERLQRSLM